MASSSSSTSISSTCCVSSRSAIRSVSGVGGGLTAIESSSVTPASSSTSSKRSGSGPWKACSAAMRSSGNMSRVAPSGVKTSISSLLAAASSSALALSSASTFLAAARWRPGIIASARPCKRPPTPAPKPKDSPVSVNTPRSGSYTPRWIRFCPTSAIASWIPSSIAALPTRPNGALSVA